MLDFLRLPIYGHLRLTNVGMTRIWGMPLKVPSTQRDKYLVDVL
jgi:hypothetical protein